MLHRRYVGKKHRLDLPIPIPMLTVVEPLSHFGDKPVKLSVICPQNGTAVLEGLNARIKWANRRRFAASRTKQYLA